jgi:NADPH:quinone reductase-like Zn-dependent oxidoreductase
MNAVTFDALDTPPRSRDDLDAPEAGSGQVLVRVRASSANPVDNAIAAGMLAQMVEHDFPVTLGRDYAGVVEAVGEGVGDYATGDEVFGFLTHANPAVHDGSWAELIAVGAEQSIARAPEGVDLATAGVAPLAGITALACVDAIDPQPGERVLIVGASGGVGSFAVQLAAQAGASVIAPGLPEDEEYLAGLGAAEVMARGEAPEADAVIDLVSYAPEDYGDARVASPLNAAGDGPAHFNVGARPTTENLDRLAGLLADGTLKVHIQATYELGRAPEALQALASTHTQGKTAISVG